MAQNTANQQLYDLLIGKNFDVKAVDTKTNLPPKDENGNPDNSKADKFTFDYTANSGKNYGTVVVFINSKDLTLMFGDNVGKTMEGQDKTDWFDFMYQLKQLGTRNWLQFKPENISKEQYVQQSQAAINESWQGKGNISWNGQPTEARLVIKHKKALGEGEARFRFIECIYIETADRERFKMKSRSLTAAKAMLEHVRQGGNPYDVRGHHINEIVEELSVLSRFRRANANKVLEGDTKSLVEQTDAYYQNMHSVLKHLGTSRGYTGYFESWNPAEVNEGNLVVEDLKQLFVEQTIDHRIEEALPILARITQEANSMKEAQIFESWINNLVEGTWMLPETPEQKQTLVDLMSKDFPVGVDAINATEQLYDVFGDDMLFDRLGELADADANADARSVVMTRLQELSDASPDVEAVLGQLQTTNPAAPEPDQMAQDVAGDEQLPQSIEEYGDTKKGQKMLTKVQKRAVDRVVSKRADTDPAYAKKHSDTANRAWERMTDKDLEEGAFKNEMHAKAESMDLEDFVEQYGYLFSPGEAEQFWHAVNDVNEAQCNMTSEGEYCPKHGLEECGIYEYTGNWTNFGLEESDELAQLKKLALGK